MSLHGLDCIVCEAARSRRSAGTIAMKKMPRQQHHVVAALAQRRHFDVQDIEAVIKVLSEAAGTHRGLEVHVSSRNDAHIDVHHPGGTHPDHGRLLQKTQQARLGTERQVAYFVEEDRTAVCSFDAADLFVMSPRESAFLVAEQQALYQSLRHRSTVDRNEGSAAYGRTAVHGERRQFLADAALAGDEDGCACPHDLVDLAVEIEHSPAATDHAEPTLEMLSRCTHGPAQKRFAMRVAQAIQQAFWIDRQSMVVEETR